MAIVLEATQANGAVTRTPIDAGRNTFRAQPGFRYRVIDDTGAKIDDNIAIRRVGNDLLISGLPENRVVEFDGFFTRCTPQNSCELMLENLVSGSAPAAAITPASEPVAAQRDGSFLMVATRSVEAAVPVAPEAESTGGFRNLGLVIAGLALAGAGGGGGGGGGGGSSGPDTTAPAAPVISSTSSKSVRPVISGTAEPGSTVSVFVDVDHNGQFAVRYTVTAAADGSWRVDTATAVPAAGAMRDLALDSTTAVRALAADAANNVSTATTISLLVDNTPPAAAVIAAVAGDNLVNGAERAAGVTVSGTAEAGATVTVTWGSIVHQVLANSSGAWSTLFASGEIPADTPASSITAVVTDAAGNVGPTSTRTVVIDSTSTVIVAAVATDDVVNGTERTAGIGVTGTAKPGASVQVAWLNAANAVVASHTVNADANGNWTTSFAQAEVPADGASTVRATATDTVGNVASYSRPVLIDTTAPTAPAITSIPEAAGGLNAAEAADGTVVNVSLAGSTAAAGDTLVVHWGAQTVLHTITAGEAGGTVAVTVPGTTIVNQGSGTVPVTVSVTDTHGNVGGASAAANVAVDVTAPTLVISDNTAGTAAGPVTFTFEFSEDVTDFTTADVAVAGGTKGAFTAIDANTYTLVVTPNAASSGNITIDVAAGAATDVAGNGSAAVATYTQPYNTNAAPTVVITDATAAAVTNAAVTFTFQFSEGVTGFAASDVVVTGGTKGTFTAVDTDTYTLVVTPTAGSTGTITVDVAANAATGITSLQGNTAATQATQGYDTVSPTVTITDDAPGTATGPVLFTFQFDEAVTGFATGDIVVAGGTKGTFTAVDADTYTLSVTPNAGSGNITVDVAAGAASDAAGNVSVAPATHTQPYNTNTAPIVTVTDDTAAAVTNAPVTFTFQFSEGVTGFAATDVVVAGGTKGTFTSVDADTYTLVVTPNPGATGTITVDVAANAATGLVSTLGNAAATQATQGFDTQPPTQTLSSFTVTDNAGAVTGPVASGGSTDDTTPALTLTLSAVLQTGETLEVLRDGVVTFTSNSTASATFNFNDTLAVRPADDYVYTARVVDTAGNVDSLVLNHSITVI